MRSTDSIHCIFPIHFFELFPGPDLQKPDIPCYIAIPVIYVDRGQDKLRKSALKKCNVRIRLISKNFYHRNIRFLGATRSKVISHRVGSSSSWSVVCVEKVETKLVSLKHLPPRCFSACGANCESAVVFLSCWQPFASKRWKQNL